MCSQTCTQCPALCVSRTRIVTPDLTEIGKPCKVLIVGEAPGAEEDRQGKGFVGRAGQTLHKLLQGHGLHRGTDYGCANIVRCRPPQNRRPSEIEVAHCLPFLAQTILKAQPWVVITVGETATRAITGIRGLADNIQFLSQHQNDPAKAEMLCPLPIRDVWPVETLLFPMPHTSPLAWNRKAPDGQPWATVGAAQVAKAVRALGRFDVFL
ncbi:MAG: uracil-DNA glycosylase [Desulfobulbus sp.]